MRAVFPELNDATGMTARPLAAFRTLIAMGAPVLRHPDQEEHFIISAECNDDKVWADYYDAHNIPGYHLGVCPEITKVLNDHGLFCEWQNPGMLNVWDA